jgi:hypothetical protein
MNTRDSINFYLINNTPLDYSVTIRNYTPQFSYKDTVTLIPADDSLLFTLYFTPDQDLFYRDFLIIEADSSNKLLISISGAGKMVNSYYATTYNLYDNDLKNALKLLVNNHTNRGYNGARDRMFMEIDNKKVNGQGAAVNTLECVYTGRLATGYTSRTDAQTNFNFNTEHTWPQSFFNQVEPERADLNHLFPTDETANNIRANYPFGYATNNVTWSVAGSKLGRNDIGATVFETRDLYKGDIARGLFYFIIRYQNWGNFMDARQENVLRQWSAFDTVSAVEQKRNDDIALPANQGKRNPFIDNPGYMERIFSFITTNERPKSPSFEIVHQTALFDSAYNTDTTYFNLPLINKGTAPLIINNLFNNSDLFSVISFPSNINPMSSGNALLAFHPGNAAAGNYSAPLIGFTNGGIDTVILTGVSKGGVVAVNDNEIKFDYFISQNYPNPFNPATTISFSLPEESNVELKVFDILGNQVAELLNERKTSGSYQVQFNGKELASGIYIYSLKAGSYYKTLKMTLLK